MDTTRLLSVIAEFFHSSKLDIIVALIMLDVVLAVAVALRTKTFDFSKLADFLESKVLPYVLAYLALHIVIGMVADITTIIGQGLDTVVFLVILASLAAAIMDNLKMLGLNLPDVRQVNAPKV